MMSGAGESYLHKKAKQCKPPFKNVHLVSQMIRNRLTKDHAAALEEMRQRLLTVINPQNPIFKPYLKRVSFHKDLFLNNVHSQPNKKALGLKVDIPTSKEKMTNDENNKKSKKKRATCNNLLSNNLEKKPDVKESEFEPDSEKLSADNNFTEVEYKCETKTAFPSENIRLASNENKTSKKRRATIDKFCVGDNLDLTTKDNDLNSSKIICLSENREPAKKRRATFEGLSSESNNICFSDTEIKDIANIGEVMSIPSCEVRSRTGELINALKVSDMAAVSVPENKPFPISCVQNNKIVDTVSNAQKEDGKTQLEERKCADKTSLEIMDKPQLPASSSTNMPTSNTKYVLEQGTETDKLNNQGPIDISNTQVPTSNINNSEVFLSENLSTDTSISQNNVMSSNKSLCLSGNKELAKKRTTTTINNIEYKIVKTQAVAEKNFTTEKLNYLSSNISDLSKTKDNNSTNKNVCLSGKPAEKKMDASTTATNIGYTMKKEAAAKKSLNCNKISKLSETSLIDRKSDTPEPTINIQNTTTEMTEKCVAANKLSNLSENLLTDTDIAKDNVPISNKNVCLSGNKEHTKKKRKVTTASINNIKHTIMKEAVAEKNHTTEKSSCLSENLPIGLSITNHNKNVCLSGNKEPAEKKMDATTTTTNIGHTMKKEAVTKTANKISKLSGTSIIDKISKPTINIQDTTANEAIAEKNLTIEKLSFLSENLSDLSTTKDNKSSNENVCLLRNREPAEKIMEATITTNNIEFTVKKEAVVEKNVNADLISNLSGIYLLNDTREPTSYIKNTIDNEESNINPLIDPISEVPETSINIEKAIAEEADTELNVLDDEISNLGSPLIDIMNYTPEQPTSDDENKIAKAVVEKNNANKSNNKVATQPTIDEIVGLSASNDQITSSIIDRTNNELEEPIPNNKAETCNDDYVTIIDIEPIVVEREVITILDDDSSFSCSQAIEESNKTIPNMAETISVDLNKVKQEKNTDKSSNGKEQVSGSKTSEKRKQAELLGIFSCPELDEFLEKEFNSGGTSGVNEYTLPSIVTINKEPVNPPVSPIVKPVETPVEPMSNVLNKSPFCVIDENQTIPNICVIDEKEKRPKITVINRKNVSTSVKVDGKPVRLRNATFFNRKVLRCVKLYTNWRRIGLAVYPAPGRPLAKSARDHLDKIRETNCAVDRNWAKFAVSAVVTENITLPQRKIIPTLMEMRCLPQDITIANFKSTSFYKNFRTKEHKIDASVKGVLDTVIDRVSAIPTPPVDEVTVNLNSIQLKNIVPYCLFHEKYLCVECGLNKNIRLTGVSDVEKNKIERGYYLHDFQKVVKTNPSTPNNTSSNTSVSERKEIVLKKSADRINSKQKTLMKYLSLTPTEISFPALRQFFIVDMIKVYYVHNEIYIVPYWHHNDIISNLVNVKMQSLIPKTVELIFYKNFTEPNYCILTPKNGMWLCSLKNEIEYISTLSEKNLLISEFNAPDLHVDLPIGHHWYLIHKNSDFDSLNFYKSFAVEKSTLLQNKFTKIFNDQRFARELFGIYNAELYPSFFFVGPYETNVNPGLTLLKGKKRLVPGYARMAHSLNGFVETFEKGIHRYLNYLLAGNNIITEIWLHTLTMEKAKLKIKYKPAETPVYINRIDRLLSDLPEVGYVNIYYNSKGDAFLDDKGKNPLGRINQLNKALGIFNEVQLNWCAFPAGVQFSVPEFKLCQMYSAIRGGDKSNEAITMTIGLADPEL